MIAREPVDNQMELQPEAVVFPSEYQRRFEVDGTEYVFDRSELSAEMRFRKSRVIDWQLHATGTEGHTEVRGVLIYDDGTALIRFKKTGEASESPLYDAYRVFNKYYRNFDMNGREPIDGGLTAYTVHAGGERAACVYEDEGSTVRYLELGIFVRGNNPASQEIWNSYGAEETGLEFEALRSLLGDVVKEVSDSFTVFDLSEEEQTELTQSRIKNEKYHYARSNGFTHREIIDWTTELNGTAFGIHSESSIAGALLGGATKEEIAEMMSWVGLKWQQRRKYGDAGEPLKADFWYKYALKDGDLPEGMTEEQGQAAEYSLKYLGYREIGVTHAEFIDAAKRLGPGQNFYGYGPMRELGATHNQVFELYEIGHHARYLLEDYYRRYHGSGETHDAILELIRQA